MFHKFRIAGLLLMMCYNVYSQEETVRINEFMALNETTLADEDGAYSDWIELYNAGADPVDLTGWALSDDGSDIKKWILPGMEIGSGEFILIFASGKDRRTPGAELHANFKLSGGGEYLALFNAEGDVLTSFEPFYPAQQTDHSYGFMDGAYISFYQPSPGKKNVPLGAVLPPPQFSVKHGIFENAFDLEMVSDFPGSEIFYSLDGSTPEVENGRYYTSPIHIDTTTILRAVSVINDTFYSEIMTRSYLFLDDVIHQVNNPPGYPSTWGPYTAIEGTAIADYEMDPEMMADPAYASIVKKGLESLSTMSLVTDVGNLFSKSTDPEKGGIYIYTGPPISRTEDGFGKGWERPASLEYFNREGTESFHVNCGVRLQGGHSRRPEKSPKHSFRVVFRSEYGPSKLNYPLFKDPGADSSFNNIILRAGFSLSWIHHSHIERSQAQYQRDIWSKDTQRAMGHPSSHSEYVHLYINGIYWGIYAPSERVDGDFAASYMDGAPEDFDVIKDYQDVIDGEISAWNSLMDLAGEGLESNEAYQQIQGNNPDGTRNPGIESLLDVVNLTDYMLINFYGSNTDWDHHNWAAARNRLKPGSGFKFLAWDSEHLLKSLTGNVLGENNPNCPSSLFQQLRQNEAYLRLFADRVQRFCFNEGVLTPGSAAATWKKRSDEVEVAIPTEAARWGDYRRDVHPFQAGGPFDLYNYDDYWVPQHGTMLNAYFPERTSIFLNQLRSAGLFPMLDAPQFFINGQAFPGDSVSRGDALSMSSDQGVIYYTTNGHDPVDWGFVNDDSGIELIAVDATKYVTVPKKDMGKLWQSDPAYDDASWAVCNGGPGGVGYETELGYEDLITLDVASDMYEQGSDPNNSCYIRIPFTIGKDDLDHKEGLYLNISYDDGFVAWLNGVRVTENNAPSELPWNAASTGSHEASQREVFNISDQLGLLKEGENLLAIQALNAKTSSSDFLFMVDMMASDQSSSGLSPHALMYDQPLILSHSSHIMARSYLDGTWSASQSSFITFPEDYSDIKMTEIHYHPLDEDLTAGSEFEFIELKNTGSSTLDLGGLSFTEGVEYTFSPESELTPGGFVVLASSELNFYDRYGFMPDAEFKGKLNNGGESIALERPDGDSLFVILYSNQAPWPLLADGSGNSLVPLEFDPVGDQNDPLNWRNSYAIGGSPGRDDSETTRVEEPMPMSTGFDLGQNYPNPFSDVTYIAYNLPTDAVLELSVYNLVGQKLTVLESGRKHAGHHVVSWNGEDDSGHLVEQGIYFYRMVIRSHEESVALTRKMIRF